jgi:hypothetical protein
MPCETNEDCITGNCTTIAQVKTCVLFDPNGADRTGNRLLIEVSFDLKMRRKQFHSNPCLVFEQKHQLVREFVHQTRIGSEL